MGHTEPSPTIHPSFHPSHTTIGPRPSLRRAEVPLTAQSLQVLHCSFVVLSELVHVQAQQAPGARPVTGGRQRERERVRERGAEFGRVTGLRGGRKGLVGRVPVPRLQREGDYSGATEGLDKLSLRRAPARGWCSVSCVGVPFNPLTCPLHPLLHSKSFVLREF